MEITIIGSGNVATHMARALKSAGHTLVEVYSKNQENARTLAHMLCCSTAHHIQDLISHNGIYLFSVSDDAYPNLISLFPFDDKRMVHTAGSVATYIFESRTKTYGVIYPFQTLSKNKEVKFKEVPLLVNGSTPKLEKELYTMAQVMSSNVSIISDEQRAALHVCAVFACNFTNHMYALAEGLSKDNNLDFSLLYPLIKETTEKAMLQSPKDSQTGPAVRNDHTVMQRHLNALKSDGLKELYKTISNSIIQNYHNGAEKL